MPAPSSPIPPGVPLGNVFTTVNDFSSKHQTKIVPMLGLPPKAKELCGEYICIDDADFKMNGKFECQPRETQCFARVAAYHELDTFERYLHDELSFDVQLVRTQVRRMEEGALKVFVNIPDLANAFFIPESLAFGDGEGKFPFGSDGDIVIHEEGHRLIWLINPTLLDDPDGAGPAIHEGSADALAALYHGDPQIAEDYNKYKHGVGSAGGLRTVNNTRTFLNIGSVEPHNAGQVYGGFFWSLYLKIFEMLKTRNTAEFLKDPASIDLIARNATMLIVLAQAGGYSVASPAYSDFTDACLAGLQGLAREDILSEVTSRDVSISDIAAAIRSEAEKRAITRAVPGAAVSSTAPASIAGFSFEKPVQVMRIGGRAFFHPQLYKSAKQGDVQVYGHGYIEQRDRSGGVTQFTQGLRRIGAGEIDEAVAMTKDQAFAAALKAAESELPREFAKRRDDAEVPASSSTKLVNAARAALQHSTASAAKLAILPKAANLVYLFDAGVAYIAIDAKTGKVARVIVKAMVD